MRHYCKIDRISGAALLENRQKVTYASPIAVDKIRIGPDRTHKTWIGSNSIKEAHVYSLEVGASQIPIKNGQVLSLDQDHEDRSRK